MMGRSALPACSLSLLATNTPSANSGPTTLSYWTSELCVPQISSSPRQLIFWPKRLRM